MKKDIAYDKFQKHRKKVFHWEAAFFKFSHSHGAT